jgi:DNA-directed RNA polymerase subunit M/transcription elongation factor TFIIS
MLLCQNCGNKHFTDGSDTSNLVEVKTAPPPRHANGTSKDTCDLPKKFKCFKCGYVFKIVKLTSEVKKERVVDEKEEKFDGDDYFKKWENDVLKFSRKKNVPPQDPSNQPI